MKWTKRSLLSPTCNQSNRERAMDDGLKPYLDILEPLLGIPLVANQQGNCRLQLRDGLDLHLESPLGGGLTILSVLETLPPGRFREQALQAALFSNGSAMPPYYSLAYSKKRGAMVLQIQLPPSLPTEQWVARFVEVLDAAVLWQDALRIGGPFPTPGGSSLPSLSDIARNRTR